MEFKLSSNERSDSILYLFKNKPTQLQFSTAENLTDALSQTNSFFFKNKIIFWSVVCDTGNALQ